MIFNKFKKIQQILNSNNGLHLSCYLSGSGPDTLIEQLHQQIENSRELLSPILNEKQLSQFLKPILKMSEDPQFLMKLGSNVGLYRTAKSFRILSLPVEVQPLSVVATSFHVKPLLKWLQIDPSFLLVGILNEEAYIYCGDQNQLRLLHRADVEHLNDVIQKLTAQDKPLLFLAGSEAELGRVKNQLAYTYLFKKKFFSYFSPKHIDSIVASIRLEIRQQVSQKVKSALVEFELADELNITRKNIFQIAKMAVSGRIRKLIVAEGINIFGKIDRSSGGISIHPFELDHEDDDILDDLAQTVLQNGGEVLVVPHELIPNKRAALAILNEQPAHQMMVASNT